MSLFSTREWWGHAMTAEEEFDKGCLCVANVDNEPDGNVKIITGSFQGMLRIFYPRSKDYRIEDLMLEHMIGVPILQLEVGRFVK